MPRKVYIDADVNLETWRHIAEAGGYTLFLGRCSPEDVVIRWGANHNRYSYSVGKILNPHLVLSKVQQAQMMVHSGVSMPRIFSAKREWEVQGSPEVVVKPNQGQMGTGQIKTTTPTFGNDKLVQLYIPKVREFRAMMVHDILAFFMEKFAPSNGDFRWNEHRGSQWASVPGDRELRRRVKELGDKGLRAIGYDFGAIDIIMDEGGKLYILEINSRPEFEQRNAQRFVRAITQYLDGV